MYVTKDRVDDRPWQSSESLFDTACFFETGYTSDVSCWRFRTLFESAVATTDTAGRHAIQSAGWFEVASDTLDHHGIACIHTAAPRRVKIAIPSRRLSPPASSMNHYYGKAATHLYSNHTYQSHFMHDNRTKTSRARAADPKLLALSKKCWQTIGKNQQTSHCYFASSIDSFI
jgi:hypothetical protein